MDRKLIQSAAEKLELWDVFLWDSTLKRNPDRDVHDSGSSYRDQKRLAVESQELVLADDENKEAPLKILRVLVDLGIRAVPENIAKPKNKDVIFEISAKFAAEFLILKSTTEAEVSEFSKYNAVHNVWPFWRQHVFSMVKAGNLPHLVVPLLRSVPGRPQVNDEKDTTAKPKKQTPKKKSRRTKAASSRRTTK